MKTFQDETQADQIEPWRKIVFGTSRTCPFSESGANITASRLYLRGQVPTFYLKQLAKTAVSGLDGVSQVVNEIEVLW